MIAVQVALAWTALTGILALAVDGGLMLAARRHAQSTADAAALAAAADLYKNYAANNGADSGSNTAATSAKDVAVSNNRGATASNATVRTYGSNYLGGPNAGTAIPRGYAEVTWTFNQARYFSNVFGGSAIPISARAVARGSRATLVSGITVLDPSGKDAWSQPGGNVTVSNGNIIVDSNNSEAVKIGGGTLTAPALEHVGGTNIQSGAFSAPPPGGGPGTLTTIGTAVSDPLASLPQPVASDYPQQSSSKLSINGDTTLQPGRYTGGITISNGTVTLSPGVYYIQGGGFNINGGTLTGNGVMIYNDPASSNDDIHLAGGVINLSPPTTGTYAGITLFENRSSAYSSDPVIISGTPGSSIKGALYFPNAPLTLTGGAASLPYGDAIVAKDVSISGGSLSVGLNPNSLPSSREINLVE
jgi:hypothetical protein